ncbi:MAG: biotin--[Oscillospiraceae bacterium]|nr:biotin--[acetyl-CoA-carboxylase] ligase [Oscillospiraceae bacterium]
MTKETILSYLGDHPWGETLIVLPRVSSTNTYLKELAKNGAPHGTVVIAELQTEGRGRLGRRFESPRGGLYLSVLLRQSPDFRLTPMAAEAVRRAIAASSGLRPQIKWINDLVCGGKKLCGILTELCGDAAVVGIGINCEGTPHEVATSLEAEGCPCDRSRLAAEVIRALSEMTPHWLTDYKRHCLTIGQDVQLIQNDAVRYAHADDMDEDGALLVTLADGTKERIFSGEVSVRGSYGYI